MPTEWPPLVGEVSDNLADRGCRVISSTDPYGRILGFSIAELYIYVSSFILNPVTRDPLKHATCNSRHFVRICYWLTAISLRHSFLFFALFPILRNLSIVWIGGVQLCILDFWGEFIKWRVLLWYWCNTQWEFNTMSHPFLCNSLYCWLPCSFPACY
jgi:hypothetical protein